jgi:hypothetical protein
MSGERLTHAMTIRVRLRNVTAGLKDHQPAQTLPVGKMSQEVTVSGTLVRKGGVPMMYVDAVR